MKSMKNIKNIPFHPLLLAIYPVLALLSFNIDQVGIWVIWRPLLIVMSGAIILTGILALVIKPFQRAAIIASFILILFFSYGQVHELLLNSKGLLFELSHHKYLGAIFLFILVIGILAIIRKIHQYQTITTTLNIISAAILILSIIPIASYSYNLQKDKNNLQGKENTDISYSGDAKDIPDIYYIILDSYTRADALQQDFNFNNSPFTTELQKLGFVVANCSRSNYGFTEVSMASSLNLNYLSDLNPKMQSGNSDLTIATALIQNNYLRRQLKNIGYKIVAFETGYDWNQWTDADMYLTPNKNPLSTAELQPFEKMLIRSTGLRLIADTDKNFLSGAVSTLKLTHHEPHVKRTMFILQWLEKLPSIAGPKFVYAHINVPHIPFIFKPDGSLVDDPNFYRGPQDYPVNEQYFKEGYINQIQFTNNRIPEIADQIIKNSSRPVIIVIQGDHGIKDDNRLDILNAVYFPGAKANIGKALTPVNTFRIIFNQFFNGKYPILENHSYLSTYELPYDLTSVPETAPDCIK
jgi:hypothetical protein